MVSENDVVSWDEERIDSVNSYRGEVKEELDEVYLVEVIEVIDADEKYYEAYEEGDIARVTEEEFR